MYRDHLTGAPRVLTIKAWADEHLFDPKDSRLHVRHRACGAELTLS